MPDFGGSPVAQNVHVPNVTSTLGGLLDLQQKQQQIQVGANTAQAAQQTMQERARVTQMMQTGQDDQGNSIRGANGEPDPAKILPALGRMAPLTGQHYAQSILQTQTAKVGLQSAATSLSGAQRTALAGPIQAIAVNPTDPGAVSNASSAIDQWEKEHPEMASAAGYARTLLSHVGAAQDPQQRAHLANSMSALLQGGQQVQTQPTPASVSTGQETQVGTSAPPVAGGGFTPTTNVQQQIPPTAPVVDPRTGQATYRGPQAPQAPGAAPVSAGVPIGTAEGITGPVAANNAHYAQVQADAASAPNRIAALQNIKEQAHTAVTGGGDYRRTVLQQLSGLFGLANDKQTANDVMAKNLAVLAGQAGNTDAARALGEMANPSYHMTEDAIRKTADQLVGIEAKKQAAQRFFSGMTTNDPQYQQRVQMWNQNADPRAFEFAKKSPAEQAAMKAELQKAGTWGALRQRMLSLHQMGVEP